MKRTHRLALIPLFTAGLLLSSCSQQAATGPSPELLEKLETFATSSKQLESRIAELEKTNRMLEGEVNLLKLDAKATAGEEENGDDLSARVAEIVNNELGELIASKLDEQAGGEGLTQQMLVSSWNQQMTAFEEKKEAEEEARREERRAEEEERRAEATAERLVRMADELGINDTQAQQLQVAMDTMRTQARDYFNEMRESGGGFDRDNIREEMTKLRDVHLQVTSQFLSDEQQTAYSEMDQGRGGFGGGFGGGGPGGGRGGRR